MLLPCPEDVRGRGNILYSNSFTGFQSPDENGSNRDYFIICFPHNEDDFDLTKIKEMSECKTLEIDDWLGRDYLKLHWTEYNKIYLVLTSMLKLGYSFQTQTKGQPPFHPKIDGTIFSIELLERNAINQCKALLKFGLSTMIDLVFCDKWNYITEEGILFSEELKSGPLKFKYNSKIEDYHKWPIFQNYDPLTLKTIIHIEKEEHELCMVCLEREPNTMVLPCEHTVCCKQCSIQLEKTSNSLKCIKCRQHIENKLY
jgi:hypothetical protein